MTIPSKPCPVCGGTDRFYWHATADEPHWRCRQCGHTQAASGEEMEAGGSSDRPQLTPEQQQHALHASTRVAQYCAGTLWTAEGQKARAYLHQRGFTDDTLREVGIGYHHADRRNGVGLDLWHSDRDAYEGARLAGLTGRQGVQNKVLQGTITLPYASNGTVRMLQGRVLPPGDGKYICPAGALYAGAPPVFFLHDLLGQCEAVVLTEGPLKALMAYQCWRQGTVAMPAVATSGGAYLPAALIDALAGHQVILAYDSDEAGQGFTQRNGAKLQRAGIDVRAIRWPNSAEKQDIDSYILAHGAAAFQRLIDEARPLDLADQPVGLVDTPRSPRFTLRTETDLARIPPPRWLLPNEVIDHGYNLIYGQSGCGKTFYAIDIALRVAGEGHPVLYVATEDLAGLRVRVQAWRQAHPHARGVFSWIEMPEGINLADHRDVGELIATIGTSYDLVVVDTLREAHVGDENSSRDMAFCNRAFQRIIRECEAAVLVVHHSGLNTERERGSTALGGNVDLKFEVSNDDGAIAVSCKKIKNGTMLPTRYYQLTPSGASAVIRPSAQITPRDAPLTKNQTAILEFLALAVFDDSGAKTTQIESGTGIRNGSLYRALSGLKSRGYISQGAKGDPYSITVSGRAQLLPDYLPAPTTTTPTTTGVGSALGVGVGGSDHGGDNSTTTEDAALHCPTTTTTSQLPAPTTVGDHSSPTTTTPTTLKGGSGGSEWWESQEQGDLFAEDERGAISPPDVDQRASPPVPARQPEVTPGQASFFSTPHAPAALPDLPTDDQIDTAGRVACFDWLQAHGLDVTGTYLVEEMRAFIKDAVAVLRE